MLRFFMPPPCSAPPELRGIAARTWCLLLVGTSRGASRTCGTSVPPRRQVCQGRHEDAPGPFRVRRHCGVCTQPQAVQGAAAGQRLAAGCRRATKLWNPLPRGGRREKGHRGPRSTAGPAGSAGPLQSDAPLTFVQSLVPLQLKPGPLHTAIRSPSSGPHTAPGCSGCCGQPAIVCRSPPRHEAWDLRASSPAVRHVGCGRLTRPGKGPPRPRLGM
ncbi:hypothetical protein NDU88_005078 [Pleurodeles waltl]|uniref:Uncharacterized protein n=1 Tax=Pleurodeles waltl TaxID=8319 RepID=A0AAV7VKX0_PLEWA|nr:hypothetical protein NDU88_005078 [Pleurodeles waltl]